MTKHILTLSPDYCMEWGLWEAVRELLQNSLDQHAVNPNSQPIFAYSPKTETLVIGNANCELLPRSLLLGVSDKRDKKKTIGQFGEGYKLALLVLTRLSFDVIVNNNEFTWTPRFEYSEEYEEQVLTIQIERAGGDADICGVHFRIRDVSPRAYEQICENYLPGVRPNVILDEDHLRGKVFVNGLFVCKLDGLEWGYNFSPDRIQLDRDRGMADSFNVHWNASKLWEQSGDTDALYKSLAKGSPDVQWVERPPVATSNALVEQFKAEHPGCVPVATEAELRRNKNRLTALVPQALKDLLVRMETFIFDKEDTPGEWIERFDHNYRHYLQSDDGCRELSAILAASKGWCGVCPPYPPEPEPQSEESTDGPTPF